MPNPLKVPISVQIPKFVSFCRVSMIAHALKTAIILITANKGSKKNDWIN